MGRKLERKFLKKLTNPVNNKVPKSFTGFYSE
jgi:hypothetical protein